MNAGHCRFYGFIEERLAMNVKNEIVKSGNVSLEHFYTDEEPNDTKLLFIHRAGHGSWMWKNFLSYFAQKNYDSWALNLRGHHLSDPVHDWAEVGMKEYLEDIDRAVQGIGDNIVLIGHSMSGLLILKSIHPSPRAIRTSA